MMVTVMHEYPLSWSIRIKSIKLIEEEKKERENF